MSFSDYWENKILDHIFGKAAYTAPTHIYVAASTADPGESGSGLSEPAGGNYARVETDPADWTAAADGQIENAAAITFPTPTADWGAITHVALFDAATGGHFLARGQLPTVQNIYSGGGPLELSAGGLAVTLD
ncbi:MAG: hypothetical protein GX448_05655 [Planctomycetes bacterium]|nr:hypothetical protein [Planctomycetota bacterium]